MKIIKFIKSLFKKKKIIRVPFSEVKKSLKHLSKNQLIRLIIRQEFEIESLKTKKKKSKNNENKLSRETQKS